MTFYRKTVKDNVLPVFFLFFFFFFSVVKQIQMGEKKSKTVDGYEVKTWYVFGPSYLLQYCLSCLRGSGSLVLWLLVFFLFFFLSILCLFRKRPKPHSIFLICFKFAFILKAASVFLAPWIYQLNIQRHQCKDKEERERKPE